MSAHRSISLVHHLPQQALNNCGHLADPFPTPKPQFQDAEKGERKIEQRMDLLPTPLSTSKADYIQREEEEGDGGESEGRGLGWNPEVIHPLSLHLYWEPIVLVSPHPPFSILFHGIKIYSTVASFTQFSTLRKPLFPTSVHFTSFTKSFLKVFNVFG